MIHANYYDLNNWCRYGIGTKEDHIIITILIIASIAAAALCIYGMTKTAKWETVVNKFGVENEIITFKFTFLIIGLVFSTLGCLPSLISPICMYFSKEKPELEKKCRPKEISKEQAEDLNDVKLTLSNAREILYSHGGKYHNDRVANLGPYFREGFLCPNADARWLKMVHAYNKASAKRRAELEVEWQKLHS